MTKVNVSIKNILNFDNYTKGFLAALISAITFGFIGLSTIRLNNAGLPVDDALAWRFIVAAFLFSLIAPFISGNTKKPRWKNRLQNIFFGAVGNGFSAGLFSVAMVRTNTGLANILLFQNPIIVFLLSWILGRSKPTKAHVTGIIGCIIGLMMICLHGKMTYDFIGLMAGIGAAVWYGSYLFLSEKRSLRFHPTWLTYDVLIGSAIAFLIISTFNGHLTVPADFRIWAIIFLQATFCTVIPILALLFSIRAIGARNATIISALEPLVTLVIGVSILHESWTWFQAAGAAILILSVVGISIQKNGEEFIAEEPLFILSAENNETNMST